MNLAEKFEVLAYKTNHFPIAKHHCVATIKDLNSRDIYALFTDGSVAKWIDECCNWFEQGERVFVNTAEEFGDGNEPLIGETPERVLEDPALVALVADWAKQCEGDFEAHRKLIRVEFAKALKPATWDGKRWLEGESCMK